jgi:hypothetical protein
VVRTWFDDKVQLVEQEQSIVLRNSRAMVEIGRDRGRWLRFCVDGQELINHRSEPDVPVDFKVEEQWMIEEHGCRFLGCEVKEEGDRVTLAVNLGVKEYPYTTALYSNMVPASLLRENPALKAGREKGGNHEYVVSCLYTLRPDDSTLRRRIRVRRTHERNFTGIRVLRFESYLFKLPGVIVGNEADCLVDMPGPIVPFFALKPRLPYAEAKREYISRRPAPDFDMGVVVFSNPAAGHSLAAWHETVRTTYVSHIIGDGNAVTLAVNEEFADYVPDCCDFTSSENVIRFDRGGVGERLQEYSRYIERAAPPMANVPAWVKDAVIAEISPRRYPTFRSIEQDLPRIKEAGFNTLWLMPIGRGGYAFADHYQIRPELGTAEDLKAMIQRAHEMGMRVLLDLVTGYMSRNSRLLAEHPEYFYRDEAGRVMRHVRWMNASTDNADPGFRQYIAGFCAFCVREWGVDGFRCDDPAAKGGNWYPHTGRAPWESTMAAHSLMGEVNRAIKQVNPEAILMNELSGPVFFQVCDISNHISFAIQLFSDEAKRAGYGVKDYKNLLADVEDIVPGEARYVWYMGNHDSFLWRYRDLAERFRKEGYPPEYFCYEAIHALVRAIPLVCLDINAPHELPPVLARRFCPAGENEVAHFYRGIYGLRQEHRVLIEGECHYRGIAAGDDRVFSVVRTLGEDLAIVLINTAGEMVEARVSMARDLADRCPGARLLKDLLSGREMHVAALRAFAVAMQPFEIAVFRAC